MLIRVLEPAFDIAVTGFDANRDLYLDVKVRSSDPVVGKSTSGASGREASSTSKRKG